MKMKYLVVVSILMLSYTAFSIEAWSQTAGSEDDVFMLEEITVTSEKREVVVQKIPSSVAVVEGADLGRQGKISTSQILESIPNIRWTNYEVQSSSPEGGIAIRGISYKMTSDGQPPSATAVYVDEIFQGIGGNYDVNRVEVLRGPQGTLYGRSATGGVVAFHTNDPKLSEFGGNASLEIGEANLKNVQAAVNAPVGDKFAVRVAGHYYERDGYFDPNGDYAEKKEGRIKALYQPTDALEILGSASIADMTNNSGGWSQTLSSPTAINYKKDWVDVAEGSRERYTQGFLKVNYDLGESILTYIGALHSYEDPDPAGTRNVMPAMVQLNKTVNPGEDFHTEELRWASDTEGRLSWLIGGNYYKGDFDRDTLSIQETAYQYSGGPEDPDANTRGATIFGQVNAGEVENYGIFTEETYEIRDDFRVTAGLRYDKTKVHSISEFNFNTNINEYGNSLLPNEFANYSIDEELEYDNITYKLRFEYDLTPDNMLYALTATGFLPGDIKIQPNIIWTTPGAPPAGVEFGALMYDEEKLISYEIGSKNRFLDNRLQLNLSAFFYDYEGYKNTVNASPMSAPTYIIVSTPVEIYGFELEADWLVTAKDKIVLSAGYLHTEITDIPENPLYGDMRVFMALEELPGTPDWAVSLSYDHTFALHNGSTLVPRAEMRYTGDYYLSQLNQSQVIMGQMPYNFQDGYVVADAGATWTSPEGKYSLTGYVRNLFDEEYKTTVVLGQDTTANNSLEDAGDPRAWGVALNVKF